MKMVKMTNFENPNRIIDTQYGCVPFAEWVAKEMVRIQGGPDRKAEIRTSIKGIALYVNKI